MIAFTFDGRRIEARAGQTIAAALTASDVVALGRRRDGTARGLWCGMGVCQECIVTVDGVPSRRACMEAAVDGMNVTSQDYAVAAPPERMLPPAPAPAVDRPQVLIVGAGPAGLAAARAAALCGAQVTIVDERASSGGQYFKQPKVEDARADAQMREGHDLAEEVRALGVAIHTDTVVWGAFGAREIAAIAGGTQRVFVPERLVLATGVYERGVPLPGWTLPGYMTTGAAQTLLRVYGVVPGKRVLVAGNGPLNFQLAAELIDAGIDVVALVEAATRPRVSELLRAAAAAPSLLARGAGYVGRLRRAAVPVLYGCTAIEAHGSDRVEACTVARVDASAAPRQFAVDAVCVGHGFLPSNQIARALGCRHRYAGRLETIVDSEGLTTVPHVYAIGDAALFRGAHAARLQGFITGCAIARSLGLAVPPRANRELRVSAQALRRQVAFQRHLWRMFEAPVVAAGLASRGTIVCRCEGVSRDAIEDAIERGATSIGAVKRRTRAGMGRCQGRYCEAATAAMLPSDRPIDELSFLSPRAPIAPARVRDLT
jgi:NADPH-dependent 2,4-dienoyl-CoA reductase/sulfur reductase-like enzyme